MVSGLFDYLPISEIVAAVERSPGNEIRSSKLASPESSAALAFNTFGFFIKRAGELPIIPCTEDCGWPATFVSIEQTAPFPWSPRGRHPWLDAFVETELHIIGIESKRYEPYRAKKFGKFSKAYWRPVWGDQMKPYERDAISQGDSRFGRLDVAQLVKHAFGLRTEGQRRGKAVRLVYLYAEPSIWPDGKEVNLLHMNEHMGELRQFGDEVSGAEVIFSACSYRSLLQQWRGQTDSEIRSHAENIVKEFYP